MRQCETGVGRGGYAGQTEQCGCGQAQELTGLGGQAAANDEIDAATGSHFVKQHVALEFELGHGLAVFDQLAVVGQHVNDVAHFQLGHIHFNGQRAGVFLCVEEDGGNFAAERYTAKALVGHKWDVLAGGPNHRVGGRLAAGTGTHHVTHVGDEVALFLQVFDELHRAALAIFLGLESCVRTGVLQHRQVVHRDVWTRGGIGRWRQVVGIGFARDLEHRDGDFFVDFRAAGEPLTIGPRLHDFFGRGVTGFGFFGHVVEVVEHQQRFLQRCAGHSSHFGVVQQFDQRMHVVATHHGAQQFGGLGLGDQAHNDVAMGHSG